MVKFRYAGYSPKSRHHGQSLNMHEVMHLIISLQMLFGSKRGGTGVLLAVLLIGAFLYFGYQGVMRQNPNKALAAADKLWENDERVDAIDAYKELLRKPDPTDPDSAWLQDSRPRLYRRVIEFEAEYGDIPVARDWIQDALKEGHRIRFDSDTARELWEEETAERKSPTGNPREDLIEDIFER